MAKLLSVGFEFRGGYHYSLIRLKEKEDCNEYKITIMNGELERLLYGNHIITEVCGEIRDEAGIKNREQQKLKQAIVKSLSDHLKLLKLHS